MPAGVRVLDDRAQRSSWLGGHMCTVHGCRSGRCSRCAHVIFPNGAPSPRARSVRAAQGFGHNLLTGWCAVGLGRPVRAVVAGDLAAAEPVHEAGHDDLAGVAPTREDDGPGAIRAIPKASAPPPGRWLRCGQQRWRHSPVSIEAPFGWHPGVSLSLPTKGSAAGNERQGGQVRNPAWPPWLAAWLARSVRSEEHPEKTP